MKKLVQILEMIKFSHTVFALPFALFSMVVAAEGVPSPSTIFWILVAMVGARSTAMAFNRLADHAIDAKNPRTAGRHLPRGLLSRAAVRGFVVVTAGLLVLAAWRLNPLCFYLAPVALVVIYGYSYTKRFTAWSHYVLGLSLSLAPMGAWIAVRGRFDVFPVLLGVVVVLWVAGFDIIYACQDTSFDQEEGLRSMSARLGNAGALKVARVTHLAMTMVLVLLASLYDFGWLFGVGILVAVSLLAAEHWLVRGGRLIQIHHAFYTMNSLVGVVVLVFGIADLWVRGRFGG